VGHRSSFEDMYPQKHSRLRRAMWPRNV
jgi:hypothetical protein